MNKPISRRGFLRQVNCAALGSAAVLNTLLNLKLANNLAAQDVPDTKTLVCIFLSGGCDAFNLLVPWEASRYAAYSNSRGGSGYGGVALDRNALLRLDAPANDFALHPSCGNLQQMANGTGAFAGRKRLAFLANVGTLVQPITKAQFLAWQNGQNNLLPVPRGLCSHVDQVQQWQTAVPQGMTQLTGWAGRAADIINDAYNTDTALMNISFGRNNTLQVGQRSQQFVVSTGGATTFTGENTGYPGNPLQFKNAALGSILEQQYTNLLSQGFAQLTKQSVGGQRFFQEQFTSANASLGPAESLFSIDNDLAPSLKAAVKSIKLRRQLGLRRQTIFVEYGGWDHHDELLKSQADMLGQLDAAVGAYQQALELLGLADDVITFTASDFGRSLRSNGRGTDHAWGTNALVFGGPVDGGKIFGAYPDLAPDNPDDVGPNGRFLPSTAVDIYCAELLRWFGVPAGSMSYVLPNISSFWNPNSGLAPLGFVKT